MRLGILALAIGLAVSPAALATTFTVTNTNGFGPGSLSQAVVDANQNPGFDTINFAIGTGHQVILEGAGSLMGPALMDGTTQPGYSGTPLIEIVGTSGGRGYGITLRFCQTSPRLQCSTENGAITLKGVSLVGAATAGVRAGSDVTIDGCFIGLRPDGETARPNATGVILSGTGSVVTNSVISGNAVGVQGGRVIRSKIGTNAAGTAAVPNTSVGVLNVEFAGGEADEGNLIAGNKTAIQLHSFPGPAVVRNNRIGLGSTGAVIPNTTGIYLLSQSDAVIEENVITGTEFHAIVVQGSNTFRNTISRNSIYGNGFGINLLVDGSDGGPTPNDSCDGDSGPNGLQNFPLISNAQTDGVSTRIQGVLNSITDPSYNQFTVEFFSSPACHAAGSGEGQTYLGSIEVTTDAWCTATIDVTLPVAVAPGHVITATATNQRQTSEFSPCVEVGSPTPWRDRRSDADGNGTADVFWHNGTTGETRIWGMFAGAAPDSLTRWFDIAGYTVATDWKPVGMADFNRDGRSDVVFRNTSSGANQIWHLDPYVSTPQWIVGAPHLSETHLTAPWEIVAVGDFEGDGDADLCFRNPTSGEVRMWLLESGVVVSIHTYLGQAGTNWKFVGSADFNGDGRADLLVHDSASRENHIWFMNRGVSGVAFLPTFPASGDSPDWAPVAVGDFDVDFKGDILWRNLASGELLLWMLDGPTRRYIVPLPSMAANWEVQTVGDFNGDGATDIGWRDASTMSNHFWLLNAGTVLSETPIAGQASTGWRMTLPH